MKGEFIRLANILELLYESGRIRRFCSIWESPEREKGMCTLINPSTPAASYNRRTAAGLAWSGLGSIAAHECVRRGVKLGARAERLPRLGTREEEWSSGADGSN